MRQRRSLSLIAFWGPLCALAAAPFFVPTAARAGGTDIPDNGTEALGRGGAFTAKADDGTALYYNIAGLARQRGTRVTLDANFVLHNTDFTRAGTYPGDPADSRTPWGGQPYPKIGDGARLSTVPFLGISTDFNYFKRWTFGFGVSAPPGVGTHDYGVSGTGPTATVKLPNGMIAPAPSRYDITSTNLIILMPTLAVAVSANRYIDLGLAAQLIYGNFDLTNANVTPIGGRCSTRDAPECDAYGNIKTSGATWGLIASAMVHPTPWMDIGVSYRPQVDLHTEGTIHATPPPLLPIMDKDAPVTFNTMLPHLLRVGIRGVSRYADGTERADLEIDGTYENWANQNDRWGRSFTGGAYDAPLAYQPDTIHSDNYSHGPGGELTAKLSHGYQDTFSLRIGGAYNHRLSDLSRIILRLGGYFDSAATDYAHTRLDFNTAVKYALTIGGGYKYRGVTVNLAYAFVYSPARNVTNSAVTAVDAFNGTNYTQSNPPITVGNGLYEPTMHILSVGLSFNFSEFGGRTRLFPN